MFGVSLHPEAVLLDAGCGSGVAMTVFHDDRRRRPKALWLVDNNPQCTEVANSILNNEANYQGKPIFISLMDMDKLRPADLYGVTHITMFPGYAPPAYMDTEKTQDEATDFVLKILNNPTTVEFNSTKHTPAYLARLAIRSPELSAALERYTVIRIKGLKQRETNLYVYMYIKREPQQVRSCPFHVAIITCFPIARRLITTFVTIIGSGCGRPPV